MRKNSASNLSSVTGRLTRKPVATQSSLGEGVEAFGFGCVISRIVYIILKIGGTRADNGMRLIVNSRWYVHFQFPNCYLSQFCIHFLSPSSPSFVMSSPKTSEALRD